MPDPVHSGRPTQPALKSDPGVDDVIAAVQKIEDAADQCFRPLALLKLPANVAIWSLLTSLIVELTEPQLSASTNHEFTNSISNASRAIGTAINWVSNYGRPSSRLVNPRWNPATRKAALFAFLEAHNYGAFQNCLPMWHKYRFAVTVVNPKLAVFQMHGEGVRDRQIAAYLKGHRPRTGTNATWNGIPQTPETSALFEDVLNHATKRKNASFFIYGAIGAVESSTASVSRSCEQDSPSFSSTRTGRVHPVGLLSVLCSAFEHCRCTRVFVFRLGPSTKRGVPCQFSDYGSVEAGLDKSTCPLEWPPGREN